MVSINSNLNPHWRFQSEAHLEDFVWNNLSVLFNLKGLARQYSLHHQVCDILAIDQSGQITIIELKNSIDRYIIQQLTRYFNAVVSQRPFLDHIDYQQPVRLIAIAPSFHAHNLIDQAYHQLSFELYTFAISSCNHGKLYFELRDSGAEQLIRLEIPEPFHPLIDGVEQRNTAQPTITLAPPKSLANLLNALTQEQQAYVLSIREQLLEFDPAMMEVGKTTRTIYGLRKNKKDIYQTKLCAEIIPVALGVMRPRLRLQLPYLKRKFSRVSSGNSQKFVKGLTWVEVRHRREWDKTTDIQLLFYFGKGRSHHSYSLSLDEYSKVYQQLAGQYCSLQSLEDVMIVALEEWKAQVSIQKLELNCENKQ